MNSRRTSLSPGRTPSPARLSGRDQICRGPGRGPILNNNEPSTRNRGPGRCWGRRQSVEVAWGTGGCGAPWIGGLVAGGPWHPAEGGERRHPSGGRRRTVGIRRGRDSRAPQNERCAKASEPGAGSAGPRGWRLLRTPSRRPRSPPGSTFRGPFSRGSGLSAAARR